MAPAADAASNIVRLNVGGSEYATTLETLTSQCPGSFLHMLFSGDWAQQRDAEGRVFIDRDGTRFRHVLNFLRSGIVHVAADGDGFCHELLEEADFYGLPELAAALHQALDAMKEQRMADELARKEQQEVLQQLSDQQRQLAVVAAVAMQQAPGGVAAQKNGLPPRSPTLARSSSAPMAWGLGPILERPVNNSTSLMSTMMMSPGRQDMNNSGAPAPSPGPQMSPTTFSADADF
jgi:hypothetical protein